MVETLQRWTKWMGGPVWLPLILALEVGLVASLAIDPRITLGLVGAIAMAVAVMERPLLGVLALIFARLLSTGATIFFRIGRMGIGPFEPALFLCLAAIVFYAVFHRTRIWSAFPWRTPFLAMTGWIGLSGLWSVSVSETIGELIPLGLVFANALVILTFVRDWRDFRWVLYTWILTCVFIGGLSLVADKLSFLQAASFKAAEGGGRSTGLGQQPNWYAMNLMFIIPTTFGLALVERSKWLRLGLIGSGAWIFYSMLGSGSRGGAYATLIGGFLVALAHPGFRKWFLRIAAGTAVVGFAIVAANFSGAAALSRVTSNGLSLNQSYRQWNWEVCWKMFQDTWGLGIGAGGYEDLLPSYNYFVSESLYDYPHGIFWEFLAHYGVVGLFLLGWLIVAIMLMAREIVRLTRGTVAEVIAWTMPAAMLGYFAWSFVEFTITEKPFWEFLAVYTALYLIARRAAAGGTPIPAWTDRPVLPWGKKKSPPEPSAAGQG
ncbi:O-antigen ligase family protein [Myxococcota bacterium]|nr:O-antigen ligase family protein [Myxococcota bacterium]